MSPVTTDLHRFMSVHLSQPISGHVGATMVYLTDVSLTHLTVLHDVEIGAEQATVVFEWEGAVAQMTGRVASTKRTKQATRELYVSDIELTHIDDDSLGSLKNLIEHYVELALDEQLSNARGVPVATATVFQTGAASQGYVRCTLQPNNTWLKVDTRDPKQPVLGFTVSKGESPSEIDMLCALYEKSNEGGRKMIRQLAEISVSQKLGVPTRKYTP